MSRNLFRLGARKEFLTFWGFALDKAVLSQTYQEWCACAALVHCLKSLHGRVDACVSKRAFCAFHLSSRNFAKFSTWFFRITDLVPNNLYVIITVHGISKSK